MSKLPEQNKFLDLSDYGRPIANLIVHILKDTKVTSIHLTLLFGISGLLAVYCILEQHFYLAGFFLILKSILDAADGEMARVKNKPSYTGRYLDSIFDILLNLLILISIAYIANSTVLLAILAFIAIQLQGTLYNYYYVILRNKSIGGDTTSKIFENKIPIAFVGENQKTVNIMFRLYYLLYFIFDKSIYLLDKNASQFSNFPSWFMTMISLYGLGFQLLIIALLLALHLAHFIIPFFIAYTILLLVFISIRKVVIRQ